MNILDFASKIILNWKVQKFMLMNRENLQLNCNYLRKKYSLPCSIIYNFEL